MASPELVWLIVAAIAAAMVIGCLRVIGNEYHRALRWHDLRVEVQRLRAAQECRLERLAEEQAARGEPEPGAELVDGEPPLAIAA